MSDVEELSFEQMRQLLRNAEARLQGAAISSVATVGDVVIPRIPRLSNAAVSEPYINSKGEVAQADASRLVTARDRLLSNQIRKIEDPVEVKKRVAKEKKATAGADWFNLPATKLTPELKRDLQLLKMRNVLDPHRHYKKDNKRDLIPQFSQVGTIIEGPTEFYSARLQNKERKNTFLEEVMAGEAGSGRFKRNYGQIQGVKTSGKKGYYKALQEKRARSRRIRK